VRVTEIPLTLQHFNEIGVFEEELTIDEMGKYVYMLDDFYTIPDTIYDDLFEAFNQLIAKVHREHEMLIWKKYQSVSDLCADLISTNFKPVRIAKKTNFTYAIVLEDKFTHRETYVEITESMKKDFITWSDNTGKYTQTFIGVTLCDVFLSFQLSYKTNKGAGINYLEKDLKKFELCNKLIAKGAPNSSTHMYATEDTFGFGQNNINSNSYTKNDVVGVSINGSRKNRISFDRELVYKALESGAIIIADNKYDRERHYNIGERELYDFIVGKHNGVYTEWKAHNGKTVGRYKLSE
jgi:hypothetical protein